MQFIRIPEDRVSVLIGSGGETKRAIEQRTKCKLEISETEVSIEGDAMDEWIAKDIVHAIGRGFNPDKAMVLANDGYVFELMDLSEFGSTPASRSRIKGRLIGANGRARRFIEQHSGALMSVYGKTVALIGPFDSVAVAKEAVSMILGGARHSAVYRMLEKRSRETN